MEKLDLFDLHCDTALRMLEEAQPLDENGFAVSLRQATGYRRYVQVMALFTEPELSNADGWVRLLEMYENLHRDPALTQGRATLGASVPQTRKGVSLLLGVEDARILDGHEERIDTLASMGVRILTPLWRGVTCIGGSHDTDEGLTDFGRRAIDRALSRGMLADISHASVASADEIIELSAAHRRPVLATHSNAHAVCSVSRNLRDGQIDRIVQSGGLIGLNLCTVFLSTEHEPCAEDVVRHADYLLSRGAERALALGCDLDGAPLPQELHGLSALPCLAETFLRHGYSETLVRSIFFENADRVMRKALTDQ